MSVAKIDIQYTYMITVSCQQAKAYVTKECIDQVLDWLAIDADVTHVAGAYELSPKYKQLHYHGLVKVKPGFRWVPWTQFGCTSVMDRTFRIWWKPISGGALDRAMTYIYKANPTRNHIVQQHIFIDNAARHEYLIN